MHSYDTSSLLGGDRALILRIEGTDGHISDLGGEPSTQLRRVNPLTTTIWSPMHAGGRSRRENGAQSLGPKDVGGLLKSSAQKAVLGPIYLHPHLEKPVDRRPILLTTRGLACGGGLRKYLNRPMPSLPFVGIGIFRVYSLSKRRRIKYVWIAADRSSIRARLCYRWAGESCALKLLIAQLRAGTHNPTT